MREKPKRGGHTKWKRGVHQMEEEESQVVDKGLPPLLLLQNKPSVR